MLEAITQKVDSSAVRHPNGEKVAGSFADRPCDPLGLNHVPMGALAMGNSPQIMAKLTKFTPQAHLWSSLFAFQQESIWSCGVLRYREVRTFGRELTIARATMCRGEADRTV